MPSTRSFKSPGIFAEDASTTIPPTPIAGVAYRDAVGGTDDVPNGWRYGTRVESQDWNQIMFLMTSMMGMMDRQGLLGWSDQVDYDVPAIVFGSNGLLYIALQESGPSTAPQDPTVGLPYWSDFAMHGRIVLTTSQTWTVPTAMQLGYIRPSVTVIGGGGGAGRFDTGGGGGGGGGISVATVNLSGVATVPVTIGAGGAGRTGSSGDGSSGGTSQFGSYATANGGGGGATWSGGAGGSASIGQVNTSYGPGGNMTRHDNPGSPSKYGGGSGGGPGGRGSASGSLAAAGSNAVFPGGGGGGGTENGDGGNGAPGVVIIEW